VLIGAEGQIGLYAHIDDFFRWQSCHLSGVIVGFKEGVDVVVDFHFQALHGVNHNVFGSDAGELALVL
jgi:hypothetical protein